VDEFSHDGDEDDLRLLASGSQASAKAFKPGSQRLAERAAR
jgi:hypothetical protein